MNYCITIILSVILQFALLLPDNNKHQTEWLTNSIGKKIRKTKEMHWNAQGDVVKSVEYIEGMAPYASNFLYKYQAGVKVRKTDLSNHEYTVYTYDKSGRLAQELEYTKSNKLQNKRIHNYKGNSKNICTTDVYEAGKPIPFMTSTFEYYSNGLLKREVQTVSGSWFLTRELKYDAGKHLIFESGQADGGVGVVKYYYTYKGDTLIKDKVVIPDTDTEYHSYETITD